MKLSRRNFLKYTALLGAIVPLFDIEKIKANPTDFSPEQLKSISEIQDIQKADTSPYYLPRHGFGYYDVYLKSGKRILLDTDEVKERYGDILSYLIEYSRPDLRIDDAHRAIWND